MEYNVVWIEDDTTYFSSRFMKFYSQCNLNVYHGGGSNRLQELLDKNLEIIDAVILDVNCPMSEGGKCDDKAYSGFISSITTMDFDRYKHIPVFVFTGRPELFDNVPDLQSSEIRNRMECERIKKGTGTKKLTAIKQLADAIKLKVDTRNSHSETFGARQKYPKEFRSALSLKLHKQFVSIVHALDTSEILNHPEYMNDLRDLVAGVLCQAREKRIMPPLQELNSLAFFLQNGYAIDRNNATKCYLLDERNPDALMNNVLRSSILFLVNSVQDAKHTEAEGPSIQVRNYLSSHAPYLMVSCIYLTIDLLLWYDSTKNQTRNLWREYSVEELKVDNGGYLYCNSGIVDQKKGREGDLVAVLRNTRNIDQYTSHFYDNFAVVKNLGGYWFKGRIRYYDPDGISPTADENPHNAAEEDFPTTSAPSDNEVMRHNNNTDVRENI